VCTASRIETHGCESAAQSRPLAPLPRRAGFARRGEGAGGKGRILLCQTPGTKSADSPRNARATKASEKREQREANFRELNKLLADVLHGLGRYSTADRVRGCHRDFMGKQCKPNGHRWAVPMKSCRFRLCAFEMRARSLRMIHRFRAKFEEITATDRARFVVLSERSCGLHDLLDAIKHLFKSFERLRHRVVWSRRVTGCVAILEVTFHAKGDKVMAGKRWTGRYYERDEWHPHLNVMWEGEYIPQAALLKAWDSCTGGEARTSTGKPAGVRIEQVINLPELFKYVTKLAPIVGNAEAVDVFVRATHRVKLVRCYGSFYDLNVEEEDDSPACCPDCGTTEIESLGRVFPEQLSLGRDGVWRFDSPETDAVVGESPPDCCEVHGWTLPCRKCVQLNAAVSNEDFFLRPDHPRLFADAAD